MRYKKNDQMVSGPGTKALLVQMASLVTDVDCEKIKADFSQFPASLSISCFTYFFDAPLVSTILLQK